MQTTIRYERSLDSAMRPVRPDGIPRRTREHPCVRAPIWGISCWRVAPRGDLEPHVHRGVSVKTSSESESVATCPHDPGEEIDLTEEHTLEALSDPGLRGAPLALPRTRSPAHAGEGTLPKPPASPFFAEKRGWRADRYHHSLAEEMSPSLRKARPHGRVLCARSLSVIAATPRALSPMFHQPRRTRAGALLPADGPFLAEKGTVDRKNLAWAYREFSMTSDSGATASSVRREQCIPRRRRPRVAPLPIHAFGAEG